MWLGTLGGLGASGMVVGGFGVHGWCGVGGWFLGCAAGGLGVHDGGLRVCSSWWQSGSHHVPVSYPSGSPLFSGALCCASLG